MTHRLTAQRHGKPVSLHVTDQGVQLATVNGETFPAWTDEVEIFGGAKTERFYVYLEVLAKHNGQEPMIRMKQMAENLEDRGFDLETVLYDDGKRVFPV